MAQLRLLATQERSGSTSPTIEVYWPEDRGGSWWPASVVKVYRRLILIHCFLTRTGLAPSDFPLVDPGPSPQGTLHCVVHHQRARGLKRGRDSQGWTPSPGEPRRIPFIFPVVALESKMTLLWQLQSPLENFRDDVQPSKIQRMVSDSGSEKDSEYFALLKPIDKSDLGSLFYQEDGEERVCELEIYE